MERSDRGGTILGAAAASLQLAAVRRCCDLGRELVAAFSASDDVRSVGNHDGAGAAGQRVLLRGVPGGNFNTERNFQRVLEPATVGNLGGGDAARDIV